LFAIQGNETMRDILLEEMRKAITSAVIRTFQKMIMVECTPVESTQSDATQDDFIGSIGFTGYIIGNCMLRLSEQTAREAVSRISGEKVENDDEIADGVGELVNMIAGNAKAALVNLGLSLTIPEVIRGQDQKKGFHTFNELFDLHFSSEIGNIYVMTAYSNALEGQKE
jgi:chemotaxis protein CheX